MSIIGPDFIALQVRDLEGSAKFYEQFLGLKRTAGPPHAVVFDTKPIAFAVRGLAEGVDLDATPQPGLGVGLWMMAEGVQEIHDELVAAGTTIPSPPAPGPFGLTFTFVDPDGYNVTLHDKA